MFDTPEAYTRRKKVLPLAMIAWALCLALGFWSIARTTDTALALYAPFVIARSQGSSAAFYGGTALRSVVAVIMGIAELGVGVGLVEYIYRRAGVADVWTPIARVLTVEITLIVLSFIL